MHLSHTRGRVTDCYTLILSEETDFYHSYCRCESLRSKSHKYIVSFLLRKAKEFPEQMGTGVNSRWCVVLLGTTLNCKCGTLVSIYRGRRVYVG